VGKELGKEKGVTLLLYSLSAYLDKWIIAMNGRAVSSPDRITNRTIRPGHISGRHDVLYLRFHRRRMERHHRRILQTYLYVREGYRMMNSETDSRNAIPAKRASTSKLSRSRADTDDTRQPVWLEATESFYKKLNRISTVSSPATRRSAGVSMPCSVKCRCEGVP
jgi:hypothetical protein